VGTRRGFTLFEVMAAVIVLGLLYTLLASTAVQGLRAEGTSRRRLEASLLADEYLSNLEGIIAVGGTPEIGSAQEEAGDYLISVNVTPFDPTPLLGAEYVAPEPGEASLLATTDVGDQGFLRTVEVAVSWIEGIDEYSVRRTTFAYDIAAAEPFFQVEGPEGGGEPGGDGGTDATAGTGSQSGRGSTRDSDRGGTPSDAAIEQMLEQLRNAR